MSRFALYLGILLAPSLYKELELLLVSTVCKSLLSVLSGEINKFTTWLRKWLVAFSEEQETVKQLSIFAISFMRACMYFVCVNGESGWT